MNRKKTNLLFVVLLLISVTLACAFGEEENNAGIDALSTAIMLTSNAAEEGEKDNTALQTAQAEATQKSQEVALTLTAQAAESSSEQQAESQQASHIVAELPVYGIDKENGQVGWVHEPVALEIDGYQQIAHANDYMHIIAKDFVLAADITWETEYGTSGCGFFFRADGNQNKPNQYIVLISRAAMGRAVFTAVADGELANFQDFYPRDEDRSFGWQNGDKNRLTIIGRGTIIELYSNGVKFGEVDTSLPPPEPAPPPKPAKPANEDDKDAMAAYEAQMAQYLDLKDQVNESFGTATFNFETKDAVFEEGFVAMIAAAESGRTFCKFTDAWLWLLDSE